MGLREMEFVRHSPRCRFELLLGILAEHRFADFLGGHFHCGMQIADFRRKGIVQKWRDGLIVRTSVIRLL